MSGIEKKKIKAPKVKGLGYIETVEDEMGAKRSPRINYPKTNLTFKPNQIDLKKVKGRVEAGRGPAHRFAEGEKSNDVPAQVVEKWIDAVLKESDDEDAGQVTDPTKEAINLVNKSKNAKGL